jgi:hypothetical protein
MYILLILSEFCFLLSSRARSGIQEPLKALDSEWILPRS